MAVYFSLSAQVTEIPKGAGYSMTATILAPNATFKAGDVRLVSDDDRVVRIPRTKEVHLHLTGDLVTGIHQLHDVPIVWRSEGLQLGDEWTALSFQLILNDTANVGNLLLGSLEGKVVAEAVPASLGKQRLSEISVRAQRLTDAGMDIRSFDHKQKGNGC